MENKTWSTRFAEKLGQTLVKFGFKKMGNKLMVLGSFWFLGEIEAPDSIKNIQ